jgi:hypothetical protein
MKSFFALALLAAVLDPASTEAQQLNLNLTPVAKAIAAEEQTPAPPPPFVYSDGYNTRLKIHKISSFAYLPLVATQGVLGKMLYDNPTPGRRSAHNAVAFGIYGLFGVNTITGTWNLIEGRKDPNGRKRRVIHSVLMLASDIGFLATAVNHPSSHEQDAFKYLDDRTSHRNLAIASISTATIGYLIMLFK